jgi:hypothetical protein
MYIYHIIWVLGDETRCGMGTEDDSCEGVSEMDLGRSYGPC